MNKAAVPYFGDQKYYNGFVSQREVDDKIEMTFLSGSLNGFARWYMLFGDQADIIKPKELKDIVKNVLGSISEKIK